MREFCKGYHQQIFSRECSGLTEEEIHCAVVDKDENRALAVQSLKVFCLFYSSVGNVIRNRRGDKQSMTPIVFLDLLKENLDYIRLRTSHSGDGDYSVSEGDTSSNES